LERLEVLLRKRIIKKVIEFSEVRNFHGVKRMAGYDRMYRLRVGDYRIIFEMMDEMVIVVKVGHRGNIY
jgi:mRNA interferase RelE/StbE